jgi:hypothetical protein
MKMPTPIRCRRRPMELVPTDPIGDRTLRRVAIGAEETPGDRASCWISHTRPACPMVHHGHRGAMPIPTCRRRRPANLVPSDRNCEHHSPRRRVVAMKEGDRTALHPVAAAAGQMVLLVPTRRRSLAKAILLRMLARKAILLRMLARIRRAGHRTSACDDGAKIVLDGKAMPGRVADRNLRKISRGRDMTGRDRDPNSMADHDCKALVASLVIETYCGDSRRLGIDHRRACPARVVTTCGGGFHRGWAHESRLATSALS